MVCVGAVELGLETIEWCKFTEAAEARCSRATAASEARSTGEVWLDELWCGVCEQRSAMAPSKTMSIMKL